MRRLARRFLRHDEDAADAVQDAFLSVIKALPRFNGACSIKTWLHRIVVNACLMKLRSGARRQTVSFDDLRSSDVETERRFEPESLTSKEPIDELIEKECCEYVRSSIQELREDYRSVIEMRLIDGRDTEQTARTLNTTPGAVKTRLHRACRSLGVQLEEYVLTS